MITRIRLWLIQWQKHRRLRRQWRQGVRQVRLVNLPLALMLQRWQSSSAATKAGVPVSTAWYLAALRRSWQIVKKMLPESVTCALRRARCLLSAALRPRLARLRAARIRLARRFLVKLLTLGILAWLRRSSSR